MRIKSTRPRIAIYARYSSDLQNPSSVDDQIALCRSLINEQFKIAGDEILVFSDAAITGATMERPGIRRLLATAEKGMFNLVVAEGLDRLSRSLKDIAAIHETLDYHGVNMWTAHEGRITALHVGLKGTMNALFLHDMKEKVKRGQKARVLAGYASSSCAYGYSVVRGIVDDKGRNVNGVRRIDEAEAAVIRRVYDEYAGGKSLPAIIAGLNADAIPAPNGGLWKRNALMGGAKKQEGLLRNEIYLGRLVFNRSYVVRDPATGRKRQIQNPESEWTKVEVPHLRIIDEALWQRVRNRDCPRLRKPSSVKRLDPILTVHNQHALTGWIKCGWCGGSKSLASDTRYVCSTWRYARTCKNSRGTKEGVIGEAVKQALISRIISGPDFRESLARAFARELSRNEKLHAHETELVDGIARLVRLIERGVDEEHTTGRILALQNELDQVRRDIRAVPSVALPDEAVIRETLLQEVRKTLATGEIERMRLMFKHVLKTVTLTPIADRRSGETLEVTLRETGWPDFWRMVTDEREALTV